jgi:hypothetical protein
MKNGFATAWRSPLDGYDIGCTDRAQLQERLGIP